MYIVFFHLSGIALLEILFYFLYVGNMETDLFSDTINKITIEVRKIDHCLSKKSCEFLFVFYTSIPN